MRSAITFILDRWIVRIYNNRWPSEMDFIVARDLEVFSLSERRPRTTLPAGQKSSLDKRLLPL